MNNGPTVKRAFHDPLLLAEIVHAPDFVVVGLKTLFETFNSGEFIRIENTDDLRYCKYATPFQPIRLLNLSSNPISGWGVAHLQ